jgi:hypothetical protein
MDVNEHERLSNIQKEIWTDWRTAYRRLGVQLSKDGIIAVGSNNGMVKIDLESDWICTFVS